MTSRLTEARNLLLDAANAAYYLARQQPDNYRTGLYRGRGHALTTAAGLLTRQGSMTHREALAILHRLVDNSDRLEAEREAKGDDPR